MSFCRLIVLPPALLVLTTILVSCGDPLSKMCDTATSFSCQTSQLPALTAPPRFITNTCPISGSWAVTVGAFAQGCSDGEPSWQVNVVLPPGPATYALPSSSVPIVAYFCAAEGDCFSNDLDPPSLQVTSGTITVKSETASGGTVSLDMEFETTAGDHISFAGPVIYGNCIPETTNNCN